MAFLSHTKLNTKDLLAAKVMPFSQQCIKISNETDTELLVLIAEDPKALILTKKSREGGGWR